MTLWYNFGGDDIHEGEDFEYDLSYSDIEGYFMSLPNEELQDAFSEAFYKLPKEEQISLLQDRGEPNFACPNFMAWLNDDKRWVISEFLMDNEILELFEDELHDEFEDEAYEQYKDRLEYRRDPYSYNGVRRSDFY